jgi:hypothetical protein
MFLLGFDHGTETWSGMKTRSRNKMAVAAAGVLALSVARVGYSGELPPTATNAAPVQTIAPASINLLQIPAEILRMSEAGMNDDVITSYIQKPPNTHALDADQIIYLHDLGLSSAVLNALVAHDQLNTSDQMAAASSETATGQTSSTEVPAKTAMATPPMSGAADSFYDSLAPYGTWVDVPAYGWCWQPTVVVVDSGWQPYCNNGCWLWTDQGWYWIRIIRGGWAPFHYGRWCRYPH